jgi:hypothetical protein
VHLLYIYIIIILKGVYEASGMHPAPDWTRPWLAGARLAPALARRTLPARHAWLCTARLNTTN